MKYDKLPDFFDTTEFKTFCKIGNIDYKQLLIRSQDLCKNSRNSNLKIKQLNSELLSNQQKEFYAELLDIINNAEIDEKEFQLALAKENIDPEILSAFDKLGIPIREQNQLLAKQGMVAMDYVIDSTSVHTSFQAELFRLGIIFCSMSEAVQNHPDLVQKYLGSVVPFSDNFFASLNSAVFSDGSFCYIPPNTRCPMELSTYFRINASGTGQFERTLIVADTGSYVSYLEGCTAPQRSENQLHSAVVELIAMENAEIKYSTVQNWYAGDKNGVGGVYNFVTKRGICAGKNSKISWTQVETGSAITWKYPSVILKGDNSVGEFHSVAIVDNFQQADTGTKMIHIGKNTRSKIVSKGISKNQGVNTYRGKVKIATSADNARNYTRCDSLFLDTKMPILPQEIDNLIAKLST